MIIVNFCHVSFEAAINNLREVSRQIQIHLINIRCMLFKRLKRLIHRISKHNQTLQLLFQDNLECCLVQTRSASP